MISSPYCEDCPRNYSPIPGDGPQPADILVIGERPGQSENRHRRVFVGKTGEELDETYLPLASLSRHNIRICNTVRCWAENNRTPTNAEIACCSRHHLPEEIRKTQPQLVILMGGSACRMVPSIRLEMHHGYPQWGRLFDYQGWIVPMYHPALGLHESKWMTQILEDWKALNTRLRCASRTEDEYVTDYQLLRGREVNDVPLADTIAIDTESHGSNVFSIQISSSPATGFMVLAEDREGLGCIDRRINNRTGIFHYAIHDVAEMLQLGVRIGGVHDTMQEAYQLGNLPQNLKSLVYRLFGFTMTSWEDVVLPYSLEALTYWMVEALQIAQADLSLIDVVRLKTKIRETVKRGPLEVLLSRVIQHTDIESYYDPWKRLDAFWQEPVNEWMTSHIEARLGRYPILGIANAPLARAVTYGCGDADWTGQVAWPLEQQRHAPYWRIAAEDRDR